MHSSGTRHSQQGPGDPCEVATGCCCVACCLLIAEAYVADASSLQQQQKQAEHLPGEGMH